MPHRLTTLLSATCAGLAAALGITGTAAAQAAPGAQAVWDRFAETCPQVVAAEHPAMFAARLDGTEGSAGQSADGAVRLSNLVIHDLDVDAQIALLITYVNTFADGRVVQCMLQVVGPVDGMDGLADLARAEAHRLFGEGVALDTSGGPVAGLDVGDGLPEGPSGDLAGAEIVRMSDGGFPPRKVLNVQVLPQVTILMLYAVQAAAE